MQQQQEPTRWNEMKSDLGKNWNKISSDEWDKTHGDEDSMSSILQERYGMSDTDAHHKLSGILGKYRGEEEANDLGNKPEKIVPKANEFGQKQEFGKSNGPAKEQVLGAGRNFEKKQNANLDRNVDQRFDQSQSTQAPKPGLPR